MAKKIAKDGLILIGGYNLSSYASTYEIEYAVNPIEVTGFTDGWKNYIPGIYSGQMSLNMFWDSASNTANAALQTLNKKCVTIVPEGSTVGNDCFTMYAEQGEWKPTAEPGAALTVGNIVFQASGIDGGPLPAQLLQHATITSSTNSTGVLDPSNAAATQRCCAVLHVWTPTSTDTYTIAVEHSTTLGSGYANLLTFTANGTSRTSEMKTVASGTINKYRRVSATRSGVAGDSFGFSVSFWHGGF